MEILLGILGVIVLIFLYRWFTRPSVYTLDGIKKVSHKKMRNIKKRAHDREFLEKYNDWNW